MLNKKITDLLNDQINKEFYSAYLYLEMSNYFEAKGLDGFANWFYVQAQEERDHAMLFYRYLQNNDEKVCLQAIAKPDKEFKCCMEALQEALNHEEYVTSLIHNIYAETEHLNDFRTREFLHWFVAEQCEEEDNARDLISKMKNFGGDNGGLYLLDQELSKRKYESPSLTLD